VNREWMRERLDEFLALCVTYDQEHSRWGDAPQLDELREQMAPKIPTVQEILKRLDPGLAPKVMIPVRGFNTSTRAIQFGLGILKDQDEWRANLAPDAPALVADQFHAHIWAAAAPLWDTGRYRVAVAVAAGSLSAHIAQKAGSHLADRELVTQVFASAAPPAGQVRLHLPGSKASKTWKSRQEGLHLVAQGAFAGIRNVATHTDEEWTEQVALEHLAVLSVVARWADETEIVKPE
jgi:hypothetical protein